MLADFSAKVHSDFHGHELRRIPVGNPYCRVPRAVRNARFLSAQQLCRLQSKKEPVGFEQLDFLHPSSFGLA